MSYFKMLAAGNLHNRE